MALKAVGSCPPSDANGETNELTNNHFGKQFILTTAGEETPAVIARQAAGHILRITLLPKVLKAKSA